MTAPPRDPSCEPLMTIDEAVAVLKLHNPNTRVMDCYDREGVTTTAIQTCCPCVYFLDWTGKTVADVIALGLQLQQERRDRMAKLQLLDVDSEIIDELKG